MTDTNTLASKMDDTKSNDAAMIRKKLENLQSQILVDDEIPPHLLKDHVPSLEQMKTLPDKNPKHDAITTTKNLILSFPKVLYSFYGSLGLILLPLHVAADIFLAMTKLFVLNPPGFEQSTFTLLCLSPVVFDTSSFCKGAARYYSIDWQTSSRGNQVTQFRAAIENGLWWERIQMSPFPIILPLSVMNFVFDLENDRLICHPFPWMPSVLTGQLWASRAHKTNNQLMIGCRCRCWKFMAPVMKFCLKLVFSKMNEQRASLPDCDRIILEADLSPAYEEIMLSTTGNINNKKEE